MKARKILTFMMSLALVIPVGMVVNNAITNSVSTVANAEETLTSTDANCFEYTDFDDVNLTVTIKGFKNNESSPTEVVIPSEIDDGNGNIYTVTALADGNSLRSEGVFYGNKNITSVVIPSTVETIGAYTFSGCSSLTNVTILTNKITNSDGTTTVQGVQTINNGAFGGCTSLTELYIPSSVTSIYDSSLHGTIVSNSMKENLTIYVDSRKDEAYSFAIDNNINVMLISEKPADTTIGTSSEEPELEDPYANCVFDVNQDGDVKSNDLLLLKKKLLGLI